MMGNGSSSSSRRRRQEDGDGGVSVFDILSLIVQDRMPITPMTLPSCLDELVDWTDEATLTVNHLTRNGAMVLSEGSNRNTEAGPVCFIPLVATDNVSANVVTQRDIDRLPEDCSFERTAFYHQDIRICVQALHPVECDQSTATPKEKSYMLSGLTFCVYLKLLRRLQQLVDLSTVESSASQSSIDHDDVANDESSIPDECRICMARPQETVLPCLHGVCSSCEARWVELHMDCPFCRQPYNNQRRRQKDQWNMENWSKEEDLENDKFALERRTHAYWKKHAVASSEGMTTLLKGRRFTRLARSFRASSTVDDDFVLLH